MEIWLSLMGYVQDFPIRKVWFFFNESNAIPLFKLKRDSGITLFEFSLEPSVVIAASLTMTN